MPCVFGLFGNGHTHVLFPKGALPSKHCILVRNGMRPMGGCCVPVCESERRMPKPVYEFHAPSAPWLPAGGKVTGIWQQVLASDLATKSYTGLTRYEAGTDTSPNGPPVQDD